MKHTRLFTLSSRMSSIDDGTLQSRPRRARAAALPLRHQGSGHKCPLESLSRLSASVCRCRYILRIYTYMYTYIHMIFIYPSIQPCIHPPIHQCNHISIGLYIHTYIRTYIHTYIRTYVHTYIHTYVHMCIYIYIYLCVCMCTTCITAELHIYMCIRMGGVQDLVHRPASVRGPCS